MLETSLQDQAALVATMIHEPLLIRTVEELARGQRDPEKLQQISNQLSRLYNSADGFYENVFLMVGEEVVADGIGGASLGKLETDEELSIFEETAEEEMIVADPEVAGGRRSSR